MIVSRKELEGKKMVELKTTIVAMGGQPSPNNETKEQLINRIVLESAKEPMENIDDPTNENNFKTAEKEETKPVVEHAMCDIKDVIRAVNPFILRGMKVFHNPNDHTWRFRVRIKPGKVRDTNTGEVMIVERWRDDSGTLKQPIDVIKRCASILMTNVATAQLTQKEYDPASDGYVAVA